MIIKNLLGDDREDRTFVTPDTTVEVTDNSGNTKTVKYKNLDTAEKEAVAERNDSGVGVVSGGKTDVERQYAVVSGKVGVRPVEPPAIDLGTVGGTLASTALGAIGGGIPGALIGGVTAALVTNMNVAENDRKYQEALREYNDMVSKNTTIAGEWSEDKDGNMVFMPDYSKVGNDINVAESGAKISSLFNLDDDTEPNVYFSDDGVLHVDINRAFANTKEYNDIINSISSDYAGLTKDDTHVDDYLGEFKQRLSSALNQYRFEVNRVAGYKSRLPNASAEAIMDAARNEIGAMLADADKKDWPVKVYRNGEIVESNAKDVLDHVYNMKDKYERDDYVESLGDMLNDNSISDDNKAYILSEYNLLFSASDADVKEGKASEERKKYAEMLDQDFFVTLFRSSGIIRGLDSLVDGAASFASQGEVDDILIANQDYLEPEEVAKNFGSFAGAAFDVFVSQKIMQGLEQKIVRPLTGAATRGIGKSLVSSGNEALERAGKKMIESSWSAITSRAGDIIGYRTAINLGSLKNSMLANVIRGFGSETTGLSFRLLARGAGQFMAYTLGELTINFASDALFDAAKLGTAIMAGEIDSEDEAAQYMKDALGQDLVMDIIFQYGPQGMLDMQTTSDAIRLQNIEPRARGVAEARTKYGEAVSAVKEAEASKATKKEISKLESDVVAAKNALTKAEVEYADAKKQWIGSRSQRFGAKLAEIESRASENEMYRKFQETVFDENAAGTALARAAYAASGGDVDLFNKLMNSTSNNLRTLTRITANELMTDRWAKGTGDALNAFKQKYSEVANYFGNLSKTDIDYLKAKNELIRYTEAAKGDKKQIDAANAFYSRYVDAVDPARAAQLDELMDTMRNVINKTNESAIGAGIQTEENIQTKRSATGFQEQGYIPMYLKKRNKNGHYIIPQERNLDRTWDRGEFWDIDNLENPALNTLTYVNYTARNIAVNERNMAVIAATEIPGMRTYRTDADNEIIRTEDGNIYKHSDIISHMEQKIDKRLGKLGKVKREAPTELEFSDEKDKILYGKVGGTHEELVDELNRVRTSAEKAQAANTAERMKIETTDNSQYVTRTAGKGKNFNYDGYLAFGRDQLTPRSLVGSPAEAFVLMPIRPGGDIDWFNGDIRRGAFAEGGQGNINTMVDVVIQNFGDEEMLDGRILRKFGIDSIDELHSYQDSIDVDDSGFRSDIADLLRNGNYTLNEPRTLYKGVSKKGNHVNTSGDFSWMDTGEYNDESFQFATLSEEAAKSFFGEGDNYILRYHLPAGQGVFYFGNVDRGYNNGGAMVLPPITDAVSVRTGETSSDGVEYLDIYVGDTSPQYRLDDTNVDIAGLSVTPGDAIRAEVNKRIDALKKYYDDTYGKFGYTTGVRVSQAKIDAFIEQGDMDGLVTYLEGLKDRASLARPTDQEVSDAVFEKQVTGLEIELKRSMNKNFPGLNNEQKRDVYARVLGEFRRRAAESGDITAKQVAEEAFARNVGYPITYFENGEEKTAYIDGPLAKPIYEMCVRSENVADRNFLQKTFEGAAKLKRYATTAIDVTRAIPNLLRDTLRGDIMSGGTDYAGARKLFAEILDAEGLTAEQKAKAMESIELAIKVAQGETLNAAIENRTERGLQDMVRETRQEGKNAVSRVIWDVSHGRIGHALETPMNVAEMYTRRRMAESAYAREFKNAKYTSTSFEERLRKAYDAGINAGMENTTNFSRRGTAVGYMARYVPYFQQNFANIESANNAFLKDPAGVAARAALFSYAYVMTLAETLKKEETRRAYYNLSDYDRKNSIVFSLDGDTLVTIPLDESLSSLVTPWRRTIETLNNVDPGTFASIFTDTMLEFLPLDFDGFTEGDGLNVRRGMEKLASQGAPSLVTELIQTITGYNLYYGTSNAVTDASLAERGQVAESAGDYTTVSANSKILRKVADATGIPQWMLQQTVENFGGSVGKYVLNTLDKLAGAAKDEQGGKDFVEAVFKSMTGTDSTNVKSQFYRGIEQLKKDRVKVVNRLQKINDDIAAADATEAISLKKEYQKVKDDYAMKVSNFVDQYLNAYEITGGLEESQAMQVYYLFNLYDDDTVYESGSVGAYHQNLAKQQAGNEAAAWAAPVLDKYYNQTQNVYKDSSGVWHYSSPYGERAYYNTIWGQGMKHQVGLRNLIEGVTSDLKDARSAAYDARSAAKAKKDYDSYDRIGADFDAKVVKAIDPYIKEYGAENVLNNSSVLDYLEEWFFVPSSFKRTKKGRYVPSLANNAQVDKAFVRPYIKSLYGVNTGYVEKNYENLLNPEVFPNE